MRTDAPPAARAVRRSASLARAAEIRNDAVGLWIWTRRPDPLVSRCAETLAGGEPFRVSGAARPTERDALIAAILDEVGIDDSPMRAALARDVSALSLLYTRVTGAQRVRVRLDAGPAQRCPRFHVDHVALRLLCTYRGAGTEWLDPADGEAHRMRAGWVGLVKGRLDGGDDERGILHRSPPTAGTARLLLVVDDATDAGA